MSYQFRLETVQTGTFLACDDYAAIRNFDGHIISFDLYQDGDDEPIFTIMNPEIVAYIARTETT